MRLIRSVGEGVHAVAEGKGIGVMTMFRYRKAIGLDVGDGVATIVIAKRRGLAVRLSRAYTIRLSSDQNNSARVLRGFFEKNGWLHLPCVIGLHGESLMLRIIDVDRGSRHKVELAVAEQMEHFSSLSNSATVSEYVVTKGVKGRVHVVLAVARMDTVLGEMDHVRRAGLNVVDVVPNPIALHNAVSRLLPRTFAPVMCVDVREESTEVVIGQGRSISFARRFLMGWQVLRGRGGGKSVDAENLRGLADFEEWLAELKGCLSFYDSRFQSNRTRPVKLVICGKSQFSPDWIARVKEATGIYSVAVAELDKTGEFSGSDGFAVAAGLAVAGTGRESVRISLLPDSLKEALALQLQFKYWLTIATAVFACMVLVVSGLRRNVNIEKRMLKEKTARVLKLKKLEVEYRDYAFKNRDLLRQLAPLRTAVKNEKIFHSVLNAVSHAKHRDDWITLIADSSSYFSQNTNDGETLKLDPETTGEYPIRPFNQIVLEGYTPLDDLSTVRAMIETLRESDFISDVDLLPDDKLRINPERDQRWSELNGRLFAVEISVGKQ